MRWAPFVAALAVLFLAPLRAVAGDPPETEAQAAWRTRLEAQLSRAERRTATLDGATAPAGPLAVRVPALDVRIAVLERAYGIPAGRSSGKPDLASLTTDVAAFGTRLDVLASRPKPPPPVAPPPSPSEPEVPAAPVAPPAPRPAPPVVDAVAPPPAPPAPSPASARTTPAPGPSPRTTTAARVDPAPTKAPAPPFSSPSGSSGGAPADDHAKEVRLFGLALGVAAAAWLGSGLIGGLCGASRRRFPAGFFLGMFFGPLGWVVALLLPAPLIESERYRRRR